MSRYYNKNRIILQVYEELKYIIGNKFLCLFFKVKYAVCFCVLDFFCAIKQKKCRSPPFIQFKKF